MEVDYIIVGQGLAGTSLAVALMDRSKKILVIDHKVEKTSSKVAAGLYNPITGRKMVKTWRADALFPYLTRFYKRLEESTGKYFFDETRIYRPFISLEEQNEWMSKSAMKEFLPFIHKVHVQSQHDAIRDPYGGIELAQSGYLNVASFLEAMEKFFLNKKALLHEPFEFDQLITTATDYVEYKGTKAKKIIFCEGTGIVNNPYFHWLPMRPVKGEVLDITSPTRLDRIVNRGVFCVPINDTTYRVGSTYDHNDTSWEPTTEARLDIEGRLNALIKMSFDHADQRAGIRPSTKDRRPYLGLHPEKETIGLFNGLGTKGVSLAPFFGDHFAQHLES